MTQYQRKCKCGTKFTTERYNYCKCNPCSGTVPRKKVSHDYALTVRTSSVKKSVTGIPIYSHELKFILFQEWDSDYVMWYVCHALTGLTLQDCTSNSKATTMSIFHKLMRVLDSYEGVSARQLFRSVVAGLNQQYKQNKDSYASDPRWRI